MAMPNGYRVGMPAGQEATARKLAKEPKSALKPAIGNRLFTILGVFVSIAALGFKDE
jgi:hypothetical protein